MKENLFNKVFPKRQEKIEKHNNINPDFKNAMEELNNLNGEDFLEYLRKFKGNTEFENYVSKFRGNDTLKKNVSHAIFYVNREEKDVEMYGLEAAKSFAEFYYPEKQLSDRRATNRALGIPLGIIGGLAVAGTVTYLEVERQFKEAENQEKAWEKEKLPLSIDEIDSQADTIFDQLNGNYCLINAKLKINKIIEDSFAKDKKNLEIEVRDDVVNSLDQFQKDNKDDFENMVFDYYLSKNNLPCNYSYLDKVGFYHDKLSEFDKKEEELEKSKEKLQERIQKAYERAGGESYVKYEDVKNSKEKVENKEVDTSAKYVGNIVRGMLAKELKAYFDAQHTPFAQEVYNLEVKLDDLNEKIENEINEALKPIIINRQNDIRNLEIASIKESKDEILIEKQKLSPDVFEYLKDYFLENEVFKYSTLKDSATTLELKTLEKDSSIMNSLSRIKNSNTREYSELQNSIESLENEYSSKKIKIEKEIQNKYALEMNSIKATLLEKKPILDKELKNLWNDYSQKFDKLFDEEMQKYNKEHNK
ncbi:hypothetical protein IT400_01250 [Candidatus Nomurabacteria bacterium]|nr:hypothetical protein [Candidatus Nomurabacteria bacterium]